MKTLGLFILAFGIFAAGYWFGKSGSLPPNLEAGTTAQKTHLQLVQNAQQRPQQAPNDPRELIPLNPNGGQGQGQGQRPQPGQGQAPQDCPVMIYQDGQLYTFPRPGQQPGQGNQPGGQPGQPQELIPLNPNQPSSPSTPNLPSTPNSPNIPNSPNTQPTPRS